jgi:hypothetical protein
MPPKKAIAPTDNTPANAPYTFILSNGETHTLKEGDVRLMVGIGLHSATPSKETWEAVAKTISSTNGPAAQKRYQNFIKAYNLKAADGNATGTSSSAEKKPQACGTKRKGQDDDADTSSKKPKNTPQCVKRASKSSREDDEFQRGCAPRKPQRKYSNTTASEDVELTDAPDLDAEAEDRDMASPPESDVVVEKEELDGDDQVQGQGEGEDKGLQEMDRDMQESDDDRLAKGKKEDEVMQDAGYEGASPGKKQEATEDSGSAASSIEIAPEHPEPVIEMQDDEV